MKLRIFRIGLKIKKRLYLSSVGIINILNEISEVIIEKQKVVKLLRMEESYMLKIGDTVKVIRITNTGELIPIGTICTVLEVRKELDGKYYYGIGDNRFHSKSVNGYYLENELEKGHLEWVKE